MENRQPTGGILLYVEIHHRICRVKKGNEKIKEGKHTKRIGSATADRVSAVAKEFNIV